MLCRTPNIVQLVILDIGPILLREQLRVYPKSATFRQDDASVQVLVQALLENPAAQIVSLALHDLAKRLAQFVVRNARAAGRLGEPGGLESPRRAARIYHIKCVAPGATEVKLRPIRNLQGSPPKGSRRLAQSEWRASTYPPG
jgi:hypothetical protein